MVPIPADPLQAWPDVHNDRRRWLCTISQLHACHQGLILRDNMLNAWQNGPWMELFMDLEIEISQLCLVYQKVPMATPQLPMKFWILNTSAPNSSQAPSYSGTVSTTSPEMSRIASVHRSFPKSSKESRQRRSTTPPGMLCFPNFSWRLTPPKRRWTHRRETFFVGETKRLQLINWLTEPVNRYKVPEKDGELVGWKVSVSTTRVGWKKKPGCYKMEKSFPSFCTLQIFISIEN